MLLNSSIVKRWLDRHTTTDNCMYSINWNTLSREINFSSHDTCFHVVLKRVQYKHLLWRTCPMLHWEWAQLACSQFSTHESQSYFQQHSWRQGPHSCCWTSCPNIQYALSMRVWCLLRQWWHCKCCVTLNFCHNSYQGEQQAGQCSAVQ